MGRKSRSRILFDGCYAHVFSRATEKKFIFDSDEDFWKFKELLLRSKQKHAYQIHHYCLMHTHFHLLVSMKSVRLFSEGLKWLKWNYARYFNYKQQRFGPLWRDRFKSLLVENERYLQACGRYVEENPVAAGLVARCEDWPYSSSRYYAGNTKDGLVDPYLFDGSPIEVKLNKEDFFTKGNVIGSELFKIQCQDEFFGGVPVPS